MKRLLILCVIAALAAAGCGGSNDDNSSPGTATSSGGAAAESGAGGQQLSLEAVPQGLKYNTDKLTAKAGKVTITMVNQSPLQHDIAIKGGVEAKGPVVGQGKKSTVTVTLKPGKYTFYCSVDGHEAAGMTGELDVN